MMAVFNKKIWSFWFWVILALFPNRFRLACKNATKEKLKDAKVEWHNTQ
jgi:hypothetical protein